MTNDAAISARVGPGKPRRNWNWYPARDERLLGRPIASEIPSQVGPGPPGSNPWGTRHGRTSGTRIAPERDACPNAQVLYPEGSRDGALDESRWDVPPLVRKLVEHHVINAGVPTVVVLRDLGWDQRLACLLRG